MYKKIRTNFVNEMEQELKAKGTYNKRQIEDLLKDEFQYWTLQFALSNE